MAMPIYIGNMVDDEQHGRNRHGQKHQENTPTPSSLQRVSAPPLAQTSLGDRKGNGPLGLKWEPLVTRRALCFL